VWLGLDAVELELGEELMLSVYDYWTQMLGEFVAEKEEICLLIERNVYVCAFIYPWIF